MGKEGDSFRLVCPGSGCPEGWNVIEGEGLMSILLITHLSENRGAPRIGGCLKDPQ